MPRGLRLLSRNARQGFLKRRLLLHGLRPLRPFADAGLVVLSRGQQPLDGDRTPAAGVSDNVGQLKVATPQSGSQRLSVAKGAARLGARRDQKPRQAKHGRIAVKSIKVFLAQGHQGIRAVGGRQRALLGQKAGKGALLETRIVGERGGPQGLSALVRGPWARGQELAKIGKRGGAR